MKRSFLPSLWFVLVAAYGQDSQEAHTILAKVAEASQSGSSYRAEFSGIAEDKGTGYNRKLEFAGSILSQPPDKLRADVKVGSAHQLTVRDGVQTWFYVSGAKTYRKLPLTTASVSNLGSLDPSALFGIVTTGLESTQIAPDEDVTLDGKQVRCYVISAKYEADQALGGISPRVTLWIDQTTIKVLRRRVVLPVRLPQYPEPMERTVDFALTKLTLTPPLAGSEFLFVSPEGVAMATPQPAQGPYRIGDGVSPPRVVSKSEPEYTEGARRARLEGTVVLSLVVGEDGAPNRLAAIKSVGFGLDEKAIEAVRKWQFAPGQKDGKPVPVLATIQVNFHLLSVTGAWRVTRAEFKAPDGTSSPMPVKVKFPSDKLSGAPGSVTLTLDVDENGSPANIYVEKSSDPKWDREVIAAVRAWKFDPGARAGAPVSVPLTIDLSQLGPSSATP
jgi:TonB family protein